MFFKPEDSFIAQNTYTNFETKVYQNIELPTFGTIAESKKLRVFCLIDGNLKVDFIESGKKPTHLIAEQGDLFILPAGFKSFDLKWSNAGFQKSRLVEFTVDHTNILQLVGQMGLNSNHLEIVNHDGIKNKVLSRFFLNFLDSKERNPLDLQLFESSYFHMIMLELLSNYNAWDLHAIDSANTLSNYKFNLVREYIMSRIHQEITLGAMAHLVGLSASHFSTLFKNKTGQSPYKYVQGIKIDLAKDLLLDTQLPISDIAQQLGFSSTSHFSSAFKRTTGISPSQIRN